MILYNKHLNCQVSMSKSTATKRPYSSTRRRDQADQTRRQILEAARALFFERGFNGASIEAIAQHAGVAPETIYATFGNKEAILLALAKVTLVGDYEPTPLLDRPLVQDATKEIDQHHLLEKFARDMYQIMTRMSPMFALLRETSKTNPEIGVILKRMLIERFDNMSFVENLLKRMGSIREQTLPDQAKATLWALSSAEVFDLLTHNLGWTKEKYIAWLSDSLIRLLLD